MQRTTSGCSPNVTPSFRVRTEESAECAVFLYYTPARNNKFNAISYTRLKNINVPFSTILLPFAKVSLVLLGGTFPPWSHKHVLYTLWQITLAQSLPDKRQMRKLNLCQIGWFSFGWLGNWSRSFPALRWVTEELPGTTPVLASLATHKPRLLPRTLVCLTLLE